MFRPSTCPSSGGQIVLSQHLQSALIRHNVLYCTESDDTRCFDNRICPPEDGHVDARNMSRIWHSGLGGLEVACWPLEPKVAGSNPAEAVGFFRAEKILSTPSLGVEVKPSVVDLRHVKDPWMLRAFQAKFTGHFSPIVPSLATRISRKTTSGESWNV
jgi:hypothetical protein